VVYIGYQNAEYAREDGMSDSEEIMKDLDSREVVRLKIDGASSTVNTLGDHKTARGVSLVCPFPALEVDVPVSFGSPESKEMKQGFIHRIGVEDDPKTGLPRLRLSIRTRNTRSTVVAEMPQALLDEASRRTELPDSHAATSLDIASSDEIMPLIADEDSGEIDPLLDELLGEEDSWSDISSIDCDDDPAWVDCSDLPLPEEFMERTKTRRRYRLARHAAWAGVLALVMAGGFMLDRAKVIDLNTIRAAVSSFSFDSMKIDSRGMIIGDKVLEETALAKTDTHAQLIPEIPMAEPVREAIPQEIEQMDFSQEDITAATGSQIIPVTAIEEELETDAPPPPPEHVELADAPEMKAVASLDPNEVTLTLPTRWPVEYATGYRVRNPNGIVVDVPGGLVKREGWLESVAKDHPMVRSIKAVQRENGARYIVFVNGDLPRFMTKSKTGGVALRLYYTDGVEVPTQIAALD
jgi:hypothetical protein